ncbi:hypothetical protein [Pseudonocardia sp. T1-2H]|uniref:hypothetical protein n=1 Tax=Pseudonocardia sp. T1-2H TaxID=3128899 RepID=UPI003100C768
MAGRSTTGGAAGRGGGTRAAAGSGRGSGASRSRTTGSSRKPASGRKAPARRPAPQKGPDLIDRGIDAVGRGVVKVGRSTGKAVGRTREIDPAHRRDGLGVGFIVLAVIAGAGVWWGAGGPVGQGFSTAVGAVFGLAGVLLPVILLGVGIVLMTTPAHPEARPRIAVGTLLLGLGVLGLVHLFAGSPDEPAQWATGGGAVGYVASTPLVSGVTVWVAVPILLLLSFYAFLVLTGIPLREVPNRFRRLLGKPEVGHEDDEQDLYDEPEDEVAQTPPAPARRRPTRRRQAAASEADAFKDEEPPPPPRTRRRSTSRSPRRRGRAARRPPPSSPPHPRRPSPRPARPSRCRSRSASPSARRSTSSRPRTCCPPVRCRRRAAPRTTP